MADPKTSRLTTWGRRAVMFFVVGAVFAGLGLSAMSVAERGARPRAPQTPLAGVRFYLPSLDDDGDGEWVTPSNPGAINGRFALLIHGLDEPGDIWDDLAPALHEAGHVVARFEYPNDQAIAPSAELLMNVLRALGAAGTEEIDIVAHSMGGLVARDALTRTHVDRAGWVYVRTLVMVGTPHAGSALAPLRGVAELRDRFQRYTAGDATLEESLNFASDGAGEAAIDLAPGSVFLDDLNARPHPVGVRLVCVVGRWAPAWADGVASEALGDGVVATESATLESAEIIEVRGNHRGMLLSMPITGEATAIGEIVRTLAEP